VLITLDFETYFDQDFSLKKMPTAAYVRDPRFSVHGAGVKREGEASQFLAGDSLDHFLRTEVKNAKVLCHNTAFDGLILSHHYGVVPEFYYDTLSMSRPLLGHTTDLDLDSLMQHILGTKKEVDIVELQGVKQPSSEELRKLAKRAMDDVDGTYGVFQHLVGQMPEEELDIIDTTIRMFTDPKIVLDRERVQAILEEEIERKEELLEKLGITEKDVNSPKRLAALFEAAGVKAPIKPSPTNPGEKTYAFARTDSAFQALKNHETEEVRDLVEARLTVKANQVQTRSKRLLEVTQYSDGLLSIPLKYCGAHTFRWSGFDAINPQNFGRSNPVLRSCLMAPEVYVLDVKDYAQIEARIVAWLADETNLVLAFADPNRDPYSEFATELFGFEVTKKTAPKHRFIGKTIILGAGFGMGAVRLVGSIKDLSIVELGEEMHVSESESQQYINAYRNKYPKISSRHGDKGLWGKMHRALEHMICGFGSYEIGPLKFEKGRVLMPNGMYILYNGLQGHGDPEYEKMGNFSYLSKDFRGARIDIYDGKLTENLVQSLARIVISQGMNRIKQRFQPLLQVHDEVVSLIPKNEAQSASDWITEQLVQSAPWNEGLPLEIEGGFDERYSK